MNHDPENIHGNVSRFYQKKSIFITGATGFMGKVLLYKLLTSCHLLQKVYVLIRSKKEKTAHDRLQDLLSEPIFATMKDSAILEKVVAISGDISLPNLGLSENGLKTIVSQVSVVFHSAATVRFNEVLTKAVAMNVEGTRSLLDLARNMPKLEAFVHVSTAFAHCYLKEIEECIPHSSSLLTYDEVIEMCRKEPAIDSPSRIKSIVGAHPNSYTFTKALAENMIDTDYKDLPLVIVRPSIGNVFLDIQYL